jgi:hypothetical protein
MLRHLRLVGEPPKEDSIDLTDGEISLAVPTKNMEDFVRALEEELRPLVRPNVGGTIKSYDLRRRGDNLYCRAKVLLDGEPDKVLVFQVDWMESL